MAFSINPPDARNPHPPDAREETTNQFLERREKELVAQIAAIRGQLAPKEAELLQIQRMKAALKLEADLNGAITSPPYTEHLARVVGGQPIPPYGAMTIKELTVQALLDHFPKGGTAAQIRDFVRDAYNRTIEASSLRPQLHRLKSDGKLEHSASEDTWNLTKSARRAYTWYASPTAKRGTQELQDDPDYPDGLLKAADALAWREDDDKS
jgi:hypothetical protein